MTNNNDSLELLISLGINDEKSRSNINEYIKKLKTESLDITLNVSENSSNSKAFSNTEKQLDSVKKKSSDISKLLSRDLAEAQVQIKKFLQEQGYKDMDFKINFDKSNGEQIIKGFTANVRDLNNQIKSISFDNTFNELKGVFKDTTLKNFSLSLDKVNQTLDSAYKKSLLTTGQFEDFRKQIKLIESSDIEVDKSGAFTKLNSEIKSFISSTGQLNKVNNEIKSTFTEIIRSGSMSEESLNSFKIQIDKINNSDITLDEKIVSLRQQLKLLNNEFDEIKHNNKMLSAFEEAKRKVQDLESAYLKTINTYKREAKQLDLSKWENEISSLKKPVEFTSSKEIDDFNKKINTAR